MDKRFKKTLIVLIVGTIIAISAFMSVWLFTYRNLINGNFNDPVIKRALLKIFKRRFIQMIAIIVSIVLIAKSSLAFQTITNNRILTPNILGFDSIYIISQTLLVFIFGTSSFLIFNQIANFVFATVVMILIVFLMFLLVMRKNKNNIVLILLLGLVIASLAGSVSNFLQVFMHPEDFQSVISLTNVNIHKINETLVFYLLPVMIILSVLFYLMHKSYDVMALGEENAINLGLNYYQKTNYSLLLITISTAISTALIGPISFLGLIAANASKELTKSNKHFKLNVTASLLSIIIVLGGQVLLEFSGFKTPVTVIINLVGGLYMIYLLLKENKA